MEKAVGYIRVSTDQQDFERQRDEIIEYAKKNEFTIVKFFEDTQSGSDYEDRAGFQDLLAFLEERTDIQIIIFDEVSRMGRDTAQQVATYKALAKNGVRIYTRGKGEFGSNKEDSLLFTVLSAIADYEKQTIIDRTSSGRRKVVRDGATQISNRPYGYNLVLTQKKDRKVSSRQFIEINKKEAKVVKEIFRIVDEGGSVNDARRYLTENSIESAQGNKNWGTSSILRVLHNTTYHGEWRFGKYYKNGKTKYSLSKRNEKDVVVVKVPAIISKRLFDRVQKKLADKKTKFNAKNTKHIYLLQGLSSCQCGHLLQCYFDKSIKQRIYRCRERNIKGLSKKDCPIKSIKADFIERILLTELKERIEDPLFFKKEKTNQLKAYKDPTIGLVKRIEKLDKEIGKEEGTLKKYYEKSITLIKESPEKAKVFESLADDLFSKIQELREGRDQLKKTLENLSNRNINYSMFKDIKKGLAFITQKEIETLTKASQEKKLEFVRKYIKGIKIEVLPRDTENLRNNLLKIRNLGLYKKENAHLKPLYFTVVNKEHNLRAKTAIQVIEAEIEFVNNFKLSIKFPYFHENPEMVLNYLKCGKAKLFNGI